jgi:SH3-like domain-containing protein
MLSGKRAVVITGETEPLLRKPEVDARAVARLEPGVIATLETCKGEWCEIEVGGYEGWMTREKLWGVYPEESFRE